MTVDFACSCGKALRAESVYAGRMVKCPTCGASVQVPQAPGGEAPAVPAAPSLPGAAAAASAPSAGPMGEPQRCGMALASLICGLLPCGCIPGLLAVIFGHIALKKIRESNGALTGHGMALAGTILGYAFLAFYLVGIVIYVIVIAMFAAKTTQMQ